MKLNSNSPGHTSGPLPDSASRPTADALSRSGIFGIVERDAFLLSEECSDQEARHRGESATDINASWESAKLPLLTLKDEKHAEKEVVVLVTPEQALLRGHVEHWEGQGARAIDHGLKFEDRIVRNMERHLAEHFRILSADLKDWIPTDALVRPAYTRFPKDAADLGYDRLIDSERPSKVGTWAGNGITNLLESNLQADSEKKHALRSPQFVVELVEDRERIQAFFVVASLRNSGGDSLACWGSSLARLHDHEEGALNFEGEVLYRPAALVQLRVSIPLNGGPEKIESDLLYSPTAFKLARQLVREAGIAGSGPEDREMHGHLVETIRSAISRQVPRFRAEDRPTLGDEPIVVDDIQPFSEKAHLNDLLVLCSVGESKFAVKVRMFIWFPEAPELSRKHEQESPYIVRCSCTPTAMPKP